MISEVSPGLRLQEGGWSASATSQPPIVAAGDRAAKPTAHRAAAGPGPTGHARDAINVPACRASRARAAPLDSEAMTFRYPAALQDVTAAYRDLAGQACSTDHVVVSGESAGGNRCRNLHEIGLWGTLWGAVTGCDCYRAVGWPVLVRMDW